MSNYILISYKARGAAIPNEINPAYNDGYEYENRTEVIEEVQDWELRFDPEIFEDLRFLGYIPEKIATVLNSHDKLVEALTGVYLNLQINASKSILFAIETDAIRAMLRNTISEVTGEDCRTLQERIESEAYKIIRP